jgi:hypothetical protein
VDGRGDNGDHVHIRLTFNPVDPQPRNYGDILVGFNTRSACRSPATTNCQFRQTCPSRLSAQQSLLGKSCFGTFETRKATGSEYDLGAVRINFGSTMPLTAMTEVAAGKAAFDRPDKVTKYDPPSQATDIIYANKKWGFTKTSGSKWMLTGDGIAFTRQVDPRPSRPNIAFVKLNCR